MPRGRAPGDPLPFRVKYLDEQFHPQERTFLGFTAQIIQHEMDHFEGKLI